MALIATMVRSLSQLSAQLGAAGAMRNAESACEARRETEAALDARLAGLAPPAAARPVHAA